MKRHDTSSGQPITAMCYTRAPSSDILSVHMCTQATLQHFQALEPHKDVIIMCFGSVVLLCSYSSTRPMVRTQNEYVYVEGSSRDHVVTL